MWKWLKKVFCKPEPVVVEPVSEEELVNLVFDSVANRPHEWRLENMNVYGWVLVHRKARIHLHGDGVIVLEGVEENTVFPATEPLKQAFLKHPTVAERIKSGEDRYRQKCGEAVRKLRGEP